MKNGGSKKERVFLSRNIVRYKGEDTLVLYSQKDFHCPRRRRRWDFLIARCSLAYSKALVARIFRYLIARDAFAKIRSKTRELTRLNGKQSKSSSTEIFHKYCIALKISFCFKEIRGWFFTRKKREMLNEPLRLEITKFWFTSKNTWQRERSCCENV